MKGNEKPYGTVSIMGGLVGAMQRLIELQEQEAEIKKRVDRASQSLSPQVEPEYGPNLDGRPSTNGETRPSEPTTPF